MAALQAILNRLVVSGKGGAFQLAKQSKEFPHSNRAQAVPNVAQKHIRLQARTRPQQCHSPLPMASSTTGTDGRGQRNDLKTLRKASFPRLTNHANQMLPDSASCKRSTRSTLQIGGGIWGIHPQLRKLPSTMRV